MTRTRKTLVAAAFAVALGLGSAGTAMAENHPGDTPVTTQDSHMTTEPEVKPLDSHMTGEPEVKPLDSHMT
ncbi:hypothetical protein, partial [Streptomyces laculatispora]|uniref:hypothetical protein n=1 Tax=Streptomyces laculatispora TaxID=887464 RepID=UPI001A93E635